jgi:hypothetical protein
MAFDLVQYGTAFTLEGVPLFEAGGTDYQVNPTLAPGDAKISKDGGPLANLATLPVVTPAGSRLVRVSLSATELTCKQAVVQLVDAAGDEWQDQLLHIHTFGHASAQIPFDFSSETVTLADGGLTAAKVASDTLTSAKFANGAIAAGKVGAAALGSSQFQSNYWGALSSTIKGMSIDGLAFDDLIAIIAASAAGNLEGAAGANVIIRQIDGTEKRIEAVTDQYGNRTITLTLP